MSKMPGIKILLEGDGVWSDLVDKDVITLKDDWQMSALPGGMASGAPSIAIRLDLPDGQVIIAETSLKLLLTAADVFKAKYGDPRVQEYLPPKRDPNAH